MDCRSTEKTAWCSRSSSTQPGWAFHGTYKVTWTDRFGSHSLLVPITGTGTG